MYPVKGIFYFLGHPRFWPLFKGRLLSIVLLSLFVYGILFTFAFLPQVAVLAIFHGPAAWFNGLVLTLGEGSAIIALLFEAFFVDVRIGFRSLGRFVADSMRRKLWLTSLTPYSSIVDVKSLCPMDECSIQQLPILSRC